ncbi:MAG TPA: DUF5074 domain-containing protein [Bacteroidales bacterium]|nr:DUF5074 domain-containing protein [Bacteroidales bacterium]
MRQAPIYIYNNTLRTGLITLALTAIILSSCEKNTQDPPVTINNLKGIFVVCEGSYGHANGDISFYDSKTRQVTKNLYYTVNGVEPGDVVQAFEIADTLGFILVNNSQKLTVVNMKTFKVVRTIYGFSYPRSIVRADQNTLYISNGNGISGNYIYSISLHTLSKSDSLPVPTGPEKLICLNSKVYAAIPGGWNNDGRSVIEIDPASFSITNTFDVASVPVDIVADKNNNIWAYCKGVADYSNYPEVTYSGAGISKIELSSKTVTTIPITNMSSPGINNLAVSADGSVIYFLNDALYSMPVNSTSLPASKLVDQQFYGVDVDPQTGDIVCLDAVNSKAVVFNTSGVKQLDFETATFPSSALFSY